MNTRTEILRLLADGELHSGADLGRRLGISRAAVCKIVEGLGERGLAVQAHAGRGYRLETAFTPLDRKRILHFLNDREPRVSARQIEIVEELDSTNRHLLARSTTVTDPSGEVCLAEVQPQGRGRRGRSWIASPYRNLMLSMAWRFVDGPAMASGLSLAAGVAVARALERYGVSEVGLKWPNDLLWRERKLAGLLADLQGEAGGPSTIVLGVGINCCIVPQDGRRIDQPWVDIAAIVEGVPDRNRLAAFVIRELGDMFRGFALGGFAAFRDEWERRHVYARQAVRVSQGDTVFDGSVEGIDAHGALRLRDARGESRTFHSGEISLRPLRP